MTEYTPENPSTGKPASNSGDVKTESGLIIADDGTGYESYSDYVDDENGFAPLEEDEDEDDADA
ncbi:hypothetical protein AB0B13_21430 [Streptomyces sp. NPDC042898]|uniref:hypothetical protein n=1 Tax=Streptomyces sp. NPDC042898 TaxID=3154334 RepID=UPI0033CFCE9A